MARQSSRKLWTQHLRSPQKASGKPADASAAFPVATFKGRLLGIDPSLRGTGIAVLEVKSASEMQLLYSNTLKLGKSLSFYDCLGDIAQEMEQIVTQYKPDHLAAEETIYVQNFRTAQILGAARGAALAAATRRKIPVFEYAPLRIKQAVVGHGRASKEQVIGMIKGLLKLDAPLSSDESDAAAAAICHAYTWKA